MFRTICAALLALLATGGLAAAHEYKLGALVIDHPYTRATQPGAPVAGGYLVIRNEGTGSDRLTGGSASFAGEVQIHEMSMDGDVMKMREVEGGLEIPAGGSVELKPGGYHIMFVGLGEQLVVGDKRKATLRFEKAGDIEIEFEVEKMGGMKTGGHGAAHGG